MLWVCILTFLPFVWHGQAGRGLAGGRSVRQCGINVVVARAGGLPPAAALSGLMLLSCNL